MAIKQQGETLILGDFLQVGENPATYKQVIGGTEPDWEFGEEVLDPSKWAGSPRYKGAGGPGLENIAQREMGPYAQGHNESLHPKEEPEE